MTVFLQTFSCFVIGVVLSSFFGNFIELFKKIVAFEKPIVLATGILSARENFIQREVTRSTWLKKYVSSNSNSVKAWFILGNSSCDIPPEYRLSQYSCEKWNINVSGLEGSLFTSQEIKFGSCAHGNKTVIYQGFSFKVNHPIVLTKLGVLSHIFMPNTQANVAILDVQSKEIITQATISSNSSISIRGYTYATIKKILLPKGYEGLILFEGFMQHSVCSTLVWNDGGGTVTFKRVYSNPYHLDSKRYSHDAFSAVSIEFFVNDLETLKMIAKEETTITEKWQLHLKEIQKEIDLEKSQYEDLLIVDSVDIYRNLPIKMLKFYKWLHSNQKFKFAMKTDDDSVINIEILVKKLQESSQFNSKTFWLWSRFRKDWPVNYIGKWTDNDYRSTYYPSFPCGAAYIMSQQTVVWLSENSGSLYPYQGEDVSLGIWLSAINPDFIEDEYFECDSSCNINSYNRVQLTPEQIHEAWSIFKKCKNLCKCNDIQNP